MIEVNTNIFERKYSEESFEKFNISTNVLKELDNGTSEALSFVNENEQIINNKELSVKHNGKLVALTVKDNKIILEE